MSSPISDYALIGDGETCALVARNGSVDFLCWPRFDSDACLCALLGDESHGHWQIAPDAYVLGIERRYVPDTLVLETLFKTAEGSVRLTDFMPRRRGQSSLIRIAEGIEGAAPMRLRLRLRFNYGSMSPWSRPHGNGIWCEVGPDQVVLHSPLPVERGEAEAHLRFTLKPGEKLAFSLCYADSSDPIPEPPDIEADLRDTAAFWTGWIGRFAAECDYREPVKRSLITLKALIHQRSGGLIAAPTLGLPESPAGGMNWDYRYCWLRDAAFTLSALLNAGYHEEAEAWRSWILRAIAGRPDMMQIMYRLDGSRRLPEYQADWLPGFEGARPVLIGNAASEQLQLDVYGELLAIFHLSRKAGLKGDPRQDEIEDAVVQHLENVWNLPSADIWETRGEPRRYVYSQAMVWVGIDRYLKSVVSRPSVDQAMVQRLMVVRQQIHDEVCSRGFNAERGHFVRHFGSHEIDASLLLLPLVGFLPVSDPRIAGTIAAVERELMDGGLVRRVRGKGDGRDEGAFLVCSCWLGDCYKMQGRAAEARAMLERVIGLANDVGLLAEEFHVSTQRMMGNFPQALTHLGVVNSALFLSGPVLQMDS
jgi:GH15 family glucan-1,4-alpha-glucosidase